jgi:cobalt-zinc-cadmium efflux system protein
MEYAPRCIDVAEVETILSSNACVRQVEKLHIWTITSGQVALCAHLVVESLSAEERDRLVRQLQAHLTEKFGIHNFTLQFTTGNQSDHTL